MVTDSNIYDYHIAKAAREYIEDLTKRERGEKVDLQQKLNKLRWVILAEKNGWNPNIYHANERIEQ